jgi:monoamine oxidase
MPCRIPMSRRQLIHIAGVASASRTLAAMGLLSPAVAPLGPPPLPPGHNRKILILGAGIAGMVLALELEKSGYDPLILEARPRAGGRNWTLRTGDTVIETYSAQRVTWDRDPHLYFNPGPARIPSFHQGILSYCRELHVPLEVICNDNRAALMQDDQAFGGKPQLNRRVVEDSKGYVAELAAKAATNNAGLATFLRAFGALDKDLTYNGSPRAGWSVPPTTEPGIPNPTLPFGQILASTFWKGPLEFPDLVDMAPTMMQPVGGIDRIAQAFYRRLRHRVRLNAEVTAIRRTAAGARIIWKDMRTDSTRVETAETVIITIPLTILRTIDADFSPVIKAAIAAPDYVPAGKVAFEAQRRFWELDHQIYGGISWTTRDITQVWYPSTGFQQQKGILLGAYIWSQEIGGRFAARAPAQRIEHAIKDGEALHPSCRKYLTKGISVAWKNIPYSRGAWVEWSEADRSTHYKALLEGDGPFLFAGEHMSYINGWQEGAVQSAFHTLRHLSAIVADTQNR